MLIRKIHCTTTERKWEGGERREGESKMGNIFTVEFLILYVKEMK